MNYRQAELFIDKVQMKQLFDDLNFSYPNYSEVNSVQCALSFVKYKGKSVLKPRAGSGSRNIYVFSTVDEFENQLSTDSQLSIKIESGEYFIEVFQQGDVYHVDVIISNSNVVLFSPSKYFSPPHKFLENNVGSYMLSELSEVYKSLEAQVNRAEESKILPDGVYHFEFFKDPVNNQMIAGEVAFRIGGGLIRSSIEQAFGINPIKLLIDGMFSFKTSRIHRQKVMGFLLNTTNKSDWAPIIQNGFKDLNVSSFINGGYSNKKANDSVSCQQKILFSFSSEDPLITDVQGLI